MKTHICLYIFLFSTIFLRAQEKNFKVLGIGDTATIEMQKKEKEYRLERKKNGGLYTGTDSILKLRSENNDSTYLVVTYEKGVLIREVYYNKHKRKADEKQFDSNGNPTAKKRWYTSGSLESEKLYDNKDSIITITEWFESGRIGKKEIIKNNQSISLSWFENGNPYTEWCTGPGANIIWCENGQIQFYALVNMGKQKAQYYNCETKICGLEGYFIDDPLFRVGKWIDWFPTGKLCAERYYRETDKKAEANYRIGIWKYYNEKGKLEKEEYYENNELVKTKEYGKPKKLTENEK